MLPLHIHKFHSQKEEFLGIPPLLCAMALRLKVLRIKAEKFERKETSKYNFSPEQLSALDSILQDVYLATRPKHNDYEVRKDIVRVFNEIAKEIYGKSKDAPVVVEFGSFSMDLFSARSDLDMSVNFTNNEFQITREKKIQTLRKFAKKFYALQSKGHVTGVHPITTAKVPILKVVDRGTGVECDLSVENRDGMLKSQLIHMICSIDERFRKLSFLLKGWAKAQNINSSKDGTLNSLSIILLVAFHLQTRTPPILPPFTALFKDGTDPVSVMKLVNNFVNYGKNNRESIAELFVTLLVKLLSIERLWSKGLCVSVCEASWTSKTWDSKLASISVEDFTDRSQNVARAVGAAEMKLIYKRIQHSVHNIFAFFDGFIEGSKLQEFLFGRAANLLPLGTGSSNFNTNGALPYSIPHDVQTNRFSQNAIMPSVVAVGAKSSLNVAQPSISSQLTQLKNGWPPVGCQQTEQAMPFVPRSGISSESWGRPTSGNLVVRRQFPGLEHAQQPVNNFGSAHVDFWAGNQRSAGGCSNVLQQTFAPVPFPSKETRSAETFGTIQEGGILTKNAKLPLAANSYCASTSASVSKNQGSISLRFPTNPAGFPPERTLPSHKRKRHQ